ncbi:MAG TPA: oxidoreductase [Streptosporangiaceae bacterium]|jgi:NAD(P)-dependent dehydrogenase (short-subunit alcohol dehydrogenase family)
MATPSQSRWTAADVPDQHGRTAVVTGATGGIGLETARVLAARGADVVLACRDKTKADQISVRFNAQSGGRVRVVHLDLSSLDSVRSAAAEIRAACPRLDLLVNNAGVMGPPCQRTKDGFELTFATNHLGPFALTGLVLDRLLATPGSRIVTVSSVGHRYGEMNFDDLQSEREYRPDRAYYQSKLANLMFSYELQRRLAAVGRGSGEKSAVGANTIALAAHPGVVGTDLWRTSPRFERAMTHPRMRLVNFWLVHSVEQGALPSLRAATDPAARGGEYYGPGRYKEYTGHPVRVEAQSRAHDVADQRRLWQASEQLTGVRYPIPAPAGAARDSA